MAKDVGAKQVIMASCAPPIRYSNVYGIDMPSRNELVAHGRTTEEVEEAIGADLVIYQTLPDLIESVRKLNPAITEFDTSIFSGKYVTGGVDEEYLSGLERVRADNAKAKHQVGGLGALEGKGGGGLETPGEEEPVAVNGAPTNGADDTVGLHNSWRAS